MLIFSFKQLNNDLTVEDTKPSSLAYSHSQTGKPQSASSISLDKHTSSSCAYNVTHTHSYSLTHSQTPSQTDIPSPLNSFYLNMSLGIL